MVAKGAVFYLHLKCRILQSSDRGEKSSQLSKKLKPSIGKILGNLAESKDEIDNQPLD